MDKKIITPEDLAVVDLLLSEHCQLREEYKDLEDYGLRSANALRRVQITRAISERLGYNVKEEEIEKMDFKTDLNKQ